MTNNILSFKSKLVMNPSKIQVTHQQDGPIIETTLAENFIIKRFLSFALKDVEYQLSQLEDSGISKQKLEENAFAGGFLIEYLNILLGEVELAIQSVQGK